MTTKTKTAAKTIVLKPGVKVRLLQDGKPVGKPLAIAKPEKGEPVPNKDWHLVGDLWTHRSMLVAA